MPKLSSLSGGKAAQHALIFGPPKVGKTQLIGDLSAEFNIIWFDLEAGKDTLLKLPMDQQDRITLISIIDTVDTPRAHATLDKVVKGGDFRICDDHGTVDCAFCTKHQIADRWTEIHIPTSLADGGTETIIVVDSLSQLTTSINSTANKLMGRSITTEQIPERAKNWGDEWDAQGKYLNRILGALQNAPYHVACTAHEIEAEREDGGIRIVPSIGTKNYAINSAKFFGHVIYMDKINLQHKAYSDTSYSNRIITGSRSDVALEGMQTMSLLPIFRGEVGVGRKPVAQQAAATLTNIATGAKPSFTLPGAKK